MLGGSGPLKIRAKSTSGGSPITTTEEESSMLWSRFTYHPLTAFDSTVAVHASLSVRVSLYRMELD